MTWARFVAASFYALSVGTALVTSGRYDSIAVVGAEVFSSITDPLDAGTRPIFGDGAGAVLLAASELGPDAAGTISDVYLGSDGDQATAAFVPGTGSWAHGVATDRYPYLRMDGKVMFRNAVERMSDAVKQVSIRSGIDLDDIDLVIPHQANTRIVESLRSSMGLHRKTVYDNIAHIGNTSAATLPIAMAQAAAEGRVNCGDRVVLAAFGGGLTWGAAALTWPDFKAPDTSHHLPPTHEHRPEGTSHP